MTTLKSEGFISRPKPTPDTRVINKEIIDEELEYWVKAITTSADQTTPKRTYKITPNIKETDTLRRVENQYINLRFTTNYWTRQQIEDIKTLQRIILNETKQVNESHWNTTTENLQEIYNDPAKFWNKVRILKGQQSSETPYLVNDRNIKIHKTAEKTELYREYWQNIFQINQEDNRNFDQQHEIIINNDIDDNLNRIQPHEKADLNRLEPNNPLTKPVETQDIKRIINNFKNKAPGKSGINKIILKNLPENAYNNFTIIVNLTMSMGYFPIIFKDGIIILILKPGKDPTKVSSYRPITLLEVPGKILEKIINERVYGFAESHNKLCAET